MYAVIGKKIKKIRTSKHLTQAVLAKRAKISVPFLSFLENGRKKGSLDTYMRLAKSLNIPLHSLFTGK